MEFARLLVGVKADEASVKKLENDFKSSLAHIEKESKKIKITPDNKSAVDAFKANMKEIEDAMKGTFKNVNLNGILDGVLKSFQESNKVNDWLAETEKVKNTFLIIRGIQEQIGSKNKALELLNPKQLNQLMEFYNSKNFDQMRSKLDEAVKNAEQTVKDIGTKSFFSKDILKNIFKGADLKKIANETADRLGAKEKINELDKDQQKQLKRLFSIQNQAMLRDYAKTEEYIKQVIAKKKELGEIETTDDAKQHLEIMTQLMSAYKSLIDQENKIKKTFIMGDADGNLKELFDDSKLLSEELQSIYDDIDFTSLQSQAGQASKDLINMIKGEAQATADTIKTQLLDKIEELVDKSFESVSKKTEQAKSQIKGKKEKLSEGGAGGGSGGSGSGSGGGPGSGSGGSGEGTGNGTGSGNGDGTPEKVPVEPDASDFIEKIQDQIKGKSVKVDVEPNTSEFGDKLTQKASQSTKKAAKEINEAAKKLRGVWLHGSDETFEEFDVGKNTNHMYGSGGYFTMSRDEADGYGENVYEFFADIAKTFEEGSKLSEEQIKIVFDNYQQYLQDLMNDKKFVTLSKIKNFDVSDLKGFASFINDPGNSTQFILNALAAAKDKDATSTDLFKLLGFDSYYEPNKGILNIFDNENIKNPKDIQVDVKADTTDLKNKISDVTQSDEYEVNITPRTEGLSQKIQSAIDAGGPYKLTIDPILTNDNQNDLANNIDILEDYKSLGEYISNNTKGPEDFFEQLQKGTYNADKSLMDLLERLGMIKDGIVSIQMASGGYQNNGGIVGDKYTLLARSASYEAKIDALIPKMQEAEKLGVNLGVIVAKIKDDNNNLVYELQNTVAGSPINEDNLDFLSATDEQIAKLISDVEKLKQAGLYVDIGGDNLFYDKNKGFSFIDLGTLKPGATELPDYGADAWADILETYLDNIKKAIPSIKNKVDDFLTHAFDVEADLQDGKYDLSKKIQTANQKSGDTKITIDNSSVKPTVDDIINELDRIPEKKNITVSVDYTDDAPYLTDERGNEMWGYRGISNAISGATSAGRSSKYNGALYYSTNPNTAAEYGNKLIKNKFTMKDPLVIDAKGNYYHNIQYLGHKDDDISKEINDIVKQMANTTDKQVLAVLKERYNNISADVSNPYGTHDTDWFAENFSKWNYDGLVIKNVRDNIKSDFLGTDIVVRDKAQIKDASFVDKFKELDEYNKIVSEQSGAAIQAINEALKKIRSEWENDQNLDINKIEESATRQMAKDLGKSDFISNYIQGFSKTAEKDILHNYAERLYKQLERALFDDDPNDALSNLEKNNGIFSRYKTYLGGSYEEVLDKTLTDNIEQLEQFINLDYYNKGKKISSYVEDQSEKAKNDDQNVDLEVSVDAENTQGKIRQAVESGNPYEIEIEISNAADIQNIIQGIVGSKVYNANVNPIIKENVQKDKISLSQNFDFDNNFQKDVVYLENYKNTLKEIEALKLQPQTDGTRIKLQELNQLAEYFASNISAIGRDSTLNPLMSSYAAKFTEQQRQDLNDIKKINNGQTFSPINLPELHSIEEEIHRIESASEGLRFSLSESVQQSTKYVDDLRSSLRYLNDEETLKEFPELSKLSGMSDDALAEFKKSGDWNQFLSTLPQAHDYLKSIGYDFSNISTDNFDLDSIIQKYKEIGEIRKQVTDMDNALPSNLFDSLSVFWDAANKGELSWTDALEQITSKAKELGFAFDEIDKKWISISESSDAALPDTTQSRKQIINKLTGKEISEQSYSALDKLHNGLDVTVSELRSLPEIKEGFLHLSDILKQFSDVYNVDETADIMTEEREALREYIINLRKASGSFAGLDKEGHEVYNGQIANERKATIVMGLPASGKSSSLVNPLSEFFKAKVIDSDIIKELLPEFQGGWGASLVHRESSKLNMQFLEETLKEGENVIIPIVGSTVNGVMKYVEKLKEAGYDVQLALNELPNTLTSERNLLRFFKTGRFLEPGFVREYGDDPTRVFEQLKERGEISGYLRYDNNVERGQRPRFVSGRGYDQLLVQSLSEVGAGRNEASGRNEVQQQQQVIQEINQLLERRRQLLLENNNETIQELESVNSSLEKYGIKFKEVDSTRKVSDANKELEESRQNADISSDASVSGATSLSPKIETLTESEHQAGQAGEQMGHNIADGANTAAEAVNNLVTAFRGISGKLFFDEENGSAWFSTEIETANTYTKSIGDLYEAKLELGNVMRVDARGASHDQIIYADTEEKIQEALAIKKQLDEARVTFAEKYKAYFDGGAKDVSLVGDPKEYLADTDNIDMLESKLQEYLFTTEQLQEIAKSKGFDSLVIDNVLDSFGGGIFDSEKLGTSIAIFNQELIKTKQLIEDINLYKHSNEILPQSDVSQGITTAADELHNMQDIGENSTETVVSGMHEISEAAQNAATAVREVNSELQNQKSSITGEQLHEQMLDRLGYSLTRSKNFDLSGESEDNFEKLLQTALYPWVNIKSRGLMSKIDFDFSKDIFNSLDDNEITSIASEALIKIMGATKAYFGKITNAIVQFYNGDISYHDLLDVGRDELQKAYTIQDKIAKAESNKKKAQSDSNIAPQDGSYAEAQSADQAAESHERAAEAAQHHAEEAKKAADAESEQIPAPSTSNTERQTEANYEEARSARDAAEAEKERKDAIASQPSSDNNALNQGAGQVQKSITDEEAALDQLKSKLQTEIPEAVDTKTQAFRSEQVEVDNLIDLEMNKIGELSNKLIEAFKMDTISGNLTPLKEFFEQLNQILGNTEGIAQAAESIKGFLGSLSTSNFDLNIDFSSLNELITHASELKDLAQNISNVSSAINGAGLGIDQSLSDKIKSLGFSDYIYNDILGAINDPSKKLEIGYGAISTEETDQLYEKLTKLKEILKEFKYEWNASEDTDAFTMFGNITSTDDVSKAIELYQTLTDNIDRFQTLTQKREANGGLLFGQEMKDFREFQTMLNEANAIAEKYNGTIDNLSEAQKNYNDTLQKYIENEAVKKQKEEEKQIEKTIDKTTQRLGKIKPGDQARWATQYDELKKAINDANDAFRNKKDVEEYNNAVNKAFETFNQYTKLPEGKSIGVFGNIDDAKHQFENMVHSYKTVLKDVSGSTMVDNNGLARWSAEVRDAEGNVQRLSATWQESTGRMVQSSKQLPQQLVGFSNVIDTVKSKLKEMATYWTARLFDPYDIIRYAKQAFNLIKEYDDAYTEMRKVSDESITSLKNYQMESFSQADKVGTTALQLQQSTADWMRLGETLKEAQESAKVSNILLNVSEFSSIDDATKSLTSATQAFKELEKIDIVDKLNNIGNNFSVSTDQLAQGLQNAAAVLKTQGNDLDQTLALLTAGNAITQDMSKTSAGIRTIALRISGTEEAKDAIADMGEDIDDFVVRTRSKTDQIIRDYTAVASNAYEGISVLDDNGNLRDTYDILLDIAKVYEEIQAEDKQRGTNRAQALVETLAGKNRSNIAASILSNPQILEDVYKASKNSQGSAQEELDKYLDSISGKVQKFQNQIQEIANAIIDSDSLKIVLDIVNSIISGVVTLTERFDGLKIVLSGIAALFLQKKGLGILDFDKSSGQFTSVFTKMATLFSGFGKMFSQSITQNLSSELSNAFSGWNLDNKTVADFMGHSDFSNISTSLQDYLRQIPAAEAQTKKLSEVLKEAEESGVGMADGLGKIGQIGIKALSTVGNMLISMAASALISFVAKQIYEIINAEQIAIDKGKQAKTAIEDINADYTDREQRTNDSGKRYNELRKGVSMKGDNITNLTLTNDEYDEFLAINKELAELYPQLITGIDSQGNSLVDLGTNANQATETLKEYLEVERMIANEKIADNIPDLTNGIIAQNNRLLEENRRMEIEANKHKEAMENMQEPLNLTNYDFDENGNGIINLDSHKYKNFDNYIADVNLLKRALDEAEVIFTDLPQSFEDGVGNFIQLDMFSLSSITQEQIELVNNYLAKEGNTLSKEASDALNKSLSKIKINDRIMEDNWRSAIPSFVSSLKTSSSFQELSEISDVIGKGITDSINNIDFTNLPDTAKEDMMSYIRQLFVYPIQDAINNSENKKETQKAIEELFTMDYGDLTNEQMRDRIESLVESIFPDDTELQTEFKIAIGFEYRDDDGNIHEHATDIRNRIFEALGGKVYGSGARGHEQFGSLRWEDAIKLTQDQMKDIDSGLSSGALKPYQIGSYQDLLDWLDEYRNKVSEVIKDGTLKEIFSNEGYQTQADDYEKSLSSLTSALETLRNDGQLTAEAEKDLEKEFSGLAKASAEAGGIITESMISEEATKVLGNYIKTFRDFAKELSPEELEGANQYIQDLIFSYEDLGISLKNVMNLYTDLNNTEIKGTESYDRRESDLNLYFSNAISDLQNSLAESGEELNMDVVYTLVALDEFSGTADEIRGKYDAIKVIWNIEVGNKKEIEKIQKDIDDRNQKRTTAEAKRSRNGNYMTLTPDDYKETLQYDLQDVTDYQRIVDIYTSELMELENQSDSLLGAFFKGLYDKMIARKQKQLDEANENLYNSQSKYGSDQKEANESGLNALNSRLKRQEASANRLQSIVDDAVKNNVKTSDDTLTKLSNFYEAMSNTYNELANANEELASKTMNTDEKADYESAAQSARESAKEFMEKSGNILGTNTEIELTTLANGLSDIQDEAQKINDEISLKQAKGLKANESEYKKLAKLSRDQVTNLSNQNAQLKYQLEFADLYNYSQEKRLDLANQIRTNESTISGLEIEAVGFDNQAKNLLVTQAKDLASNIATALSEVTSETGLAQETIDALTAGFSDLAGSVDVSKVFYNTTDGVKVNVVALEELAKKQNEIVNAQFAQKMADAQAKLADAAKGTQAYKEATEEIRQLMEQQAEYFAQYEEQMKKFNEHGMIELADATKNPGEGYDKAIQYMKSAKEMWDKGLVGTDDFKTRAAYFDDWGFTDADTFKANYDKMSKYFTEDDALTGLRAFYSDLLKEGLATYDTLKDGSQVLTANFDSISEAAQKMGMSEIAFQDIWGKAEEYGGVNIYIDSMQEATLKTNEYKTALENAQNKYMDMISQGASQEVLDQQKNVINEIKQNLQDVDQSTQNYVERTKQGYIDEFNNLPQIFDNIRKAFTDGIISEEQAIKQMQELASKYHINLSSSDGQFPVIDEDSYSAQAEKLGFNYMDKALQAAQERYDTASHNFELSSTTDNGNAVLESKQFLDLMTQVTEASEQADSGVNDLVNKLSEVNFENLDIKFADGKLSDQYGDIETALDGLLSQLGLGQESGELLLEVLKQIVAAKKEAEENAELFNFGNTEEAISSIDQKIKGLEETKATIDVDTEEGQAEIENLNSEIAKLEEQKDITLAVQTMIENGSTIDDLLNLSENKEVFIAELGIDESQYETALSIINGLRESAEEPIETPILVKIDEESVNSIAEKIQSQNPTVTVDAEIQEDATTTTNTQTVHVEAENEIEAKVKQPVKTPIEQEGEILAVVQQPIQVPVTLTNIEESVGDVKASLEGAVQTINAPKIFADLEVGELNEENIPDKTTKTTTVDGTFGNLDETNIPEKTTKTTTVNGIFDELWEVPDVIVNGTFGELDETKIPKKASETTTVNGIFGELWEVPEAITIDGKIDKVDESNIPKEASTEIIVNGTFGSLNEENMPESTKTNPSTKAVINEIDEDKLLSYKAPSIPVTVSIIKPEDEMFDDGVIGVERIIDDSEVDYDNEGTVTIHGENSQAKEAADEAEEYANNKEPVMPISADTDPGQGEVDSFVSNVESTVAVMPVDVNLSQAESSLNSLTSQPRSITVDVYYNNHGGPSTNKMVKEYTGTMISPAKVDGTAYNVRNYIPVGSGYANGNVGLEKSQEALVNELGTESIIRDGKWFLIPGGMHVESLKKDDIILNHLQTKDLMEHGEALGHGKVVGGARAFAQGSLAYNGMSAYSSPGMRVPVGPIGGSQGLIGPSSSTSTSTSDSLNEAAENLSEAAEEASDAAEEAGSALDGFKEWLGKLFDWIEVKLNSQEKKLDKIVSDAERALDNKNYDKAILKYNEAIEKSTDLITTSTKSASKYRALAEQVLNKAIEAGAIDSNMAAEIKFKVESGDMNIEEYSDDVREVISAYQQWAEKVEQTEDKISDLQDKLNDYVDSLKEVADTQRDVAVSNADMYSDIGGGTYAFSGGAKYNQLRASDENIRLTNNAYAKNVNDVYNAMKTVRGGAINSIKANQDTNASYNEALGEAQKNMNNGSKIPDSVIQEVAKRNPTMAAQLQAYNRAQDNYQTANLEYVTKVTENSALKQQNTADKFDAIDSQLENEINNLEQQNEDSDLAASEKNHNIDRIAQRQTKIASNATARADAYRREESTYKTQITQTKSAKGANYNGLTMKAKTNVNNVCQEALNAAKSGGRIKDTTLTKLAQFVGSGLVTAAFYESCVNYNNAYEHRLEAEQAAEIAQVTRKKQAEENALQKISNISDEAEKQRKSITIANNEKRRQLSARKAMGEDVEEEETQLELDEQRQIYKNRKDEERHILQQMKGMDKNSDTYRQAAERLDEVREGASEAGNKIAELSGQMADLKLSGFDKAIEKLDKLKSRIQSVLDLNEAKGNYTDKTKLGQIAQAARDQAEQSRQKARKYESNANLAKKNGGTWAGHTQDYWEEQANSARIDQNKYQTEAYNTDKAIRELPFEKWNDFTDLLDGDIQALDNKADLAELKGTLVDVSVLEEKRSKLLEKQNIHNKKIAELQKLINDPNIGEKQRNEYMKQLKEEQNALDNTTQSLIQTNQSITNLDLDKLNKAIEVFNLIADNALQTINTIKAEGHYATEEDYQEAVEAQSSAADYAKDARDEAYNNWQAAKADPNHEYGGFSEQDLFKTFLQADTEWKQARATLAETTKSMKEVWREQFSADSNLAHQETENWEEHLRTKEADGQYITADDITKTIGLVYDELNMKLVEHAKLQELLEEAQQEGREADADVYQQLLGENEQGTEQLEQKIYNLRDQVTAKEIEACDEIINYWQSWIDQFKSTLDPDESKWTTEQKKLLEDASTKIANANEKKGSIYKEASETAKKEGRGKAANDYAQKMMAAFTQANQTRKSISDLWESKDTSSSEEEDTLADKLQRELNLLDAEYNILKSKQELLQAQGEDIDPEGYQKRIDALLAKIKKNEELVKANMQLANSSKGDDKKAKEYLQNAKQAEAEVYNLQVEMQNLGDEMRKTWITKDLDEFLDKLGVLMNSLETISGFISNDMMYSMGQITDYGLTSMAMLIKSYEVNNKELGALLEKRAAYIEEYNDGQNPYYSKKEFIEDYKSITAEIQKTAGNAYSLMNRIVDATIKMHEEEVKQIQSVIDKRKELLQQQKDYYAWDRTLKQKTNDISMLEKQRAALQGLTDSESRARLQKINKQLADAREDLENTVTDHNIELQVNGLDALKESLSKSLEEFSKQAKSDVENLMATVDDASELVNGSIERVENNITKMLDAIGAEGLDKVSIGYRPYLIPDYTGAQTYVLSDGTILDSDISGKISGGSAGLAGGISSQASSANVKYIVPDMNAQMAPIPRTSDHEVNIQSIINNYTINDASSPDEVWQTIRSKTRELANAISEEIMHNVSYSGIKKNWN